MGVTSYTTTQYTVKCDCCEITEVCADSWSENVHNKQQAIKWAGMHSTKKGILCDACYKEYRRQ